MVAVAGRAAQIDPIRAGDHRSPFARLGEVGLGEAEIDVVVVGDDPQFPVRAIDMIFAVWLARRDQRQRLRRVIGADEPHFARRIVAGRDEDQGAVLRLADADTEPELVGFLIERDVLGRRPPEPMIARAVAAPILIDLGEHQPGAVAGPHRLADPDVGDRFDHFAGRKVADSQLEALGPVVVDQGREQFAVGADLERAEPEIILALGLGRFVEDDLVARRPRPACGTRSDIARPA